MNMKPQLEMMSDSTVFQPKTDAGLDGQGEEPVGFLTAEEGSELDDGIGEDEH